MKTTLHLTAAFVLSVLGLSLLACDASALGPYQAGLQLSTQKTVYRMAEPIRFKLIKKAGWVIH